MEENRIETDKIELNISLSDLFSILVKNVWIIVTCAILCGTAVYIFNEKYIVPIYSSEVMFYIVPVGTIGADEYSESAKLQLEAQSLSYAKQVKNTYLQIFQTNTFNTKLEENYAARFGKELNGEITVTGITDTELFQMQVTSSSQSDAYEIASQIERTVPEIILEIIGSDSIRIVDKAVMPELPINHNTNRNTLIGIVLGAMFVYGIAFLIFIFDRRIRGEEDLKSHYNVPILGGIVDFSKTYKEKAQY
jgi:capsular polysaccharide biosynthesis protein